VLGLLFNHTLIMVFGVPQSCQRGYPKNVIEDKLWENVGEHLSVITFPPEFSRAKSNFPILSALYLSRDTLIISSTSYRHRNNGNEEHTSRVIQ